MVGKSRAGSRSRGGWRVVLCALVALGAGLREASAGAVSPRVPDAPTITSVKAGSFNVTVAFKGPANDGGSRILGYQAACTSTDGGRRGSHHAPSSPIRVPGLGSNRSYSCAVTARNGVGVGRASVRSAPVVVRPTVPGAPRITSVKAIGLRALTVAFAKPANDGGAPITNYRVACTNKTGGAARSQTGPHSPTRVGGLSPAQAYTCTVAAANRIAVGRASTPSAPVVVRPTAPGAPAITSVKNAGLHGVTVRFTKPAHDGGAPITNYRVACTSTNGGVGHSRVGPRSPITVPRLTFGKKYTCTVAASNNIRRGAPSRPSKPFIPRPS